MDARLMKRPGKWAILASVITLAAQAQPEVPLPVFQGVTIQPSVTVDANTGFYAYQYLLTNPAANTARLWLFELIVGSSLCCITLTSDAGWGPANIVSNPPAMRGLVPSQAYLAWSTWEEMPSLPLPGTTSGPFGLQSGRPPCVREALVQPWLHPYFQAVLQATNQDGWNPDEQERIELSYIRKLSTLGPLGVQPGSFEHWDTFVSDVAKAAQLSWITDSALLSTIQTNLTAARQAAVAQDHATVHAKLQVVIDAVRASTPSQRTNEGFALVLYNAQYLQTNIPWPCEPKLTLAPTSATHAVGETHTVTATLTNVANGVPIANNTLTFAVTNGPHAGRNSDMQTDAAGKAAFSYVGTKTGTDTIIVHTPYGTIRQTGVSAPSQVKGAPSATQAMSATDCYAYDATADAVHVTWAGGPDLRVPIFVPPVLLSSPGKTFYITETTMNAGNLPAAASITRYYLSPTQPVDPATASVAGQRSVPPLAPGESSEVQALPFVVPVSLPAGTYYLDACADADKQVIETDETNNCASSQLQVMLGAMPANQPPNCSKAAASPSLLWPPNHKLVPVSITGVTDPDGDPVTVTITGITQDEPTNGLGDGDTCPDGFGVGTAQAQLRAERSGIGNGRVYAISFKADDGKGGTCTGTVKVGVPHDKKDTPVDDGQKYDSTRCLGK